jgi:hypothetical protein
MNKLKYPTKSHKGKAGRKPAELPSFFLRLRATEAGKEEFYAMLTKDARKNFDVLYYALRQFRIWEAAQLAQQKEGE